MASSTGHGSTISQLMKPVAASLLFGVSSSLIVLVNKMVLTVFKFPSFQILGIGQIVAILLVIGVAKNIGLVSFPDLSSHQCRKVWPLPLFYILNLIFGLGSTKKLNLPMFTVLRRFSLFFITVGQMYVLNHFESKMVNFTLFIMVAGAVVAALNDMTFDLVGYVFILINDFTTAASVIYSKKMLNSEMSKLEIMYYNCLVSLLPALLIATASGDITNVYNYEGWTNYLFLICFFLSCIMGFVLMYATVLANELTSPLTVAVVGCIKNVFVTYSGLFIGGDYVFEIYNFIGINISVGGSMVYSFIKLKEHQSRSAPDATKSRLAQGP